MPKNLRIPCGPIAVSPSSQIEPVVKSVQHSLRCGSEPAYGITSSGGPAKKIFKQATQQREKEVVRARANSKTLVDTLLTNPE